MPYLFSRKKLIDLLAPMLDLLGPLAQVDTSKIVLLRRDAEMAQWMRNVLKRTGSAALRDAPLEVKSNPAIALAFLQMSGLTHANLIALLVPRDTADATDIRLTDEADPPDVTRADSDSDISGPWSVASSRSSVDSRSVFPADLGKKTRSRNCCPSLFPSGV